MRVVQEPAHESPEHASRRDLRPWLREPAFHLALSGPLGTLISAALDGVSPAGAIDRALFVAVIAGILLALLGRGSRRTGWRSCGAALWMLVPFAIAAERAIPADWLFLADVRWHTTLAPGFSRWWFVIWCGAGFVFGLFGAARRAGEGARIPWSSDGFFRRPGPIWTRRFTRPETGVLAATAGALGAVLILGLGWFVFSVIGSNERQIVRDNLPPRERIAPLLQQALDRTFAANASQPVAWRLLERGEFGVHYVWVEPAGVTNPDSFGVATCQPQARTGFLVLRLTPARRAFDAVPAIAPHDSAAIRGRTLARAIADD